MWRSGPGLRNTCRGHSKCMRIRRQATAGPAPERNVADLRAAVTDTHALLFHAGNSRALGSKAAAHFRAAERSEALIFVPMAVLLEVTLLFRAGRGGLRI